MKVYRCKECKDIIFPGIPFYDFEGEPICEDCVPVHGLEVDESFTCSECGKTFTGKDGETSIDYYQYFEKKYCNKCIKEFVEGEY